MVLQLCKQFLNTYLESDRYDEVFYRKLTYLYSLGRDAEFEAGIEAFFLEHPDSSYVGKVRSLRAYNLENQSRFDEALAEWDKIDDPALLLEVYQRKETVYAEDGQLGKSGGHWPASRRTYLRQACTPNFRTRVCMAAPFR